jgi:branched-chain amino acid aminotransferase
MIVFLNGEFVDEERAMVSVFDRSFLYGDGLFETIGVCEGRPFRWQQHWERLQSGADWMRLRLPFTGQALLDSANELIRLNAVKESTLRLTVSRGVGVRGYSPRDATNPTVVMSVHPAPPPGLRMLRHWKLVTSSVRLFPTDKFSAHKTANRLPQILARAEADEAGADEALLLNPAGNAVEGSSSNLFWIQNGRICTPPLEHALLPGITRAVLLELCQQFGLSTEFSTRTPRELLQAEGIFLSFSSLGIAEAVTLDHQPVRRSGLTERLHAAYWDLVRRECSAP